MYEPESVQEFETHEILRGFEIQMDHRILVQRIDQIFIKKKRICHLDGFAIPVDQRKDTKRRRHIWALPWS